jgi:hypothetical protein
MKLKETREKMKTEQELINGLYNAFNQGTAYPTIKVAFECANKNHQLEYSATPTIDHYSHSFGGSSFVSLNDALIGAIKGCVFKMAGEQNQDMMLSRREYISKVLPLLNKVVE